jgi:hypothetical protein
MAHTARHRGGGSPGIGLLPRADALDIAVAAALASSACVIVWGGWMAASPTIQKVAHVAALYLSNARG